ncbi:MAG: hypothetical protein Kow00108_12320 [Calditrichia bacterium]
MKKLYRSKNDRVLAGVCGGLADYFEIDANLIRFLFIVFIFFSGIGLLLYIASIFIIPEEETDAPVDEPVVGNAENKIAKTIKSVKFWGYVFVFAGLLLLLEVAGIFDYWIFTKLNFSMVLGLIFLAIGLYLLYFRKDNEDIQQELEDVKKKFHKNKHDKIIAGVCSGLAETYKVDVSIMRILWVILAIVSSGIFILIYLVLAIFLPVKAEEHSNPEEATPDNQQPQAT